MLILAQDDMTILLRLALVTVILSRISSEFAFTDCMKRANNVELCNLQRKLEKIERESDGMSHELGFGSPLSDIDDVSDLDNDFGLDLGQEYDLNSNPDLGEDDQEEWMDSWTSPDTSFGETFDTPVQQVTPLYFAQAEVVSDSFERPVAMEKLARTPQGIKDGITSIHGNVEEEEDDKDEPDDGKELEKYGIDESDDTPNNSSIEEDAIDDYDDEDDTIYPEYDDLSVDESATEFGTEEIDSKRKRDITEFNSVTAVPGGKTTSTQPVSTTSTSNKQTGKVSLLKKARKIARPIARKVARKMAMAMATEMLKESLWEHQEDKVESSNEQRKGELFPALDDSKQKEKNTDEKVDKKAKDEEEQAAELDKKKEADGKIDGKDKKKPNDAETKSSDSETPDKSGKKSKKKSKSKNKKKSWPKKAKDPTKVNKTAFQSSTFSDKFAKKAIDNNWSSSYGRGSCTRTKARVPGWWATIFESPVTVKGLKIQLPSDCCYNRLRSLEVSVDDVLCSHEDGPFRKGQLVEITCANLLTGTEIKVRSPKSRIGLVLCEVSIF